MDKKIKLITIGISVFVLLVLVANVAYSFFSSLINTTNNIDVSINIANGSYIFTVDGGSDVNFSINFNDIQSNTVSNSTPIKNNSTNLNVSLYSPEGLTTVCTYDIIWTWDTSNGYSQYTTSSMGTIPQTYDVGGIQTTFDKEFAVGIKLNNNDVLPLKDFSLLSTTGAVTTLKKSAKISSYNDNTTKNSYDINTQIFNLPIDQTAIKGKEFSGKISVDNVSCKMTQGEVEESPIHAVSGDGTNVGDKICIGDGTSDCFFVISNDGTNVQMLAEYNLLVGYKNGNDTSQGSYSTSDEGYGLQSSSAKGWIDGGDEYIGTLTFSSTNYWYNNTTDYHIPAGGSKYYVYDSNSKLYQYVNNYVSYLNSEYDINAEGNLLSYEQATAFGCEEYDYCSDDYPWVYNSSYWLGSVYDGDYVWGVYSDGYFDNCHFQSDDVFGVRPVIKISTSLVS